MSAIATLLMLRIETYFGYVERGNKRIDVGHKFPESANMKHPLAMDLSSSDSDASSEEEDFIRVIDMTIFLISSPP